MDVLDIFLHRVRNGLDFEKFLERCQDVCEEIQFTYGAPAWVNKNLTARWTEVVNIRRAEIAADQPLTFGL